MEELCIDVNSTFPSSTTSSSPRELSSSPSSSSCHASPPPSRKHAAARRLTVSNLSYSIHSDACAPAITTSYLRPGRKPAAPAEVLESVSFTASSSEILAVVGPSGAGKSTLLRVVSGRVERSQFDPRTVSLNGRPVTSPSKLRQLCGFVTQEDDLLPLLTVKETLMFSASFRLQRSSARENQTKVDGLIRELGLEHVAHSYVGDNETGGISGGERKRVAIGADVIHDPPILLLDEPTSGLDSSSALQVIEMLACMAQARNQVLILTIHQAGYRILRYISSFLLLSHGKVAHFGSLRSLEATLSQMGLKVPVRLNTLECAMEIIQQLQEHYKPKYTAIWPPLEQEAEECMTQCHKYSCTPLEEVKLLSWRFWKVVYRTKQLLLARTMQAVVGGLGLASVYSHTRTDADGVAERLGLFAFSLSFLLSSTVEALPVFLQERRVLMRETSRGMYRLSSYMIANTAVFIPFLLVVALLFAVPVYWIVELNPSTGAFLFFVLAVWMIVLMASSLVLFLGALSSDYVLGNSLICVFLGVFFLFSGYFIPKDDIPRYWIFMYYVSLYRYPLDALLINEYWDQRGKCFSWQGASGPSACALTGADVLAARGLDRDTRWLNVGIMCSFFFMYRFLCWIMLLIRANKSLL